MGEIDITRARHESRGGYTSRTVRLSPEQWDWLDSQPDKAAATLREIVARAMKNT